MSKALLVIDMQNACVGENHAAFFRYDNAKLIAGVNAVIEENKDNLVVYIRNYSKRNFINKFAPVQVYEGSTEGELIEELHIVSDHVFDKFSGDAFSNSQLDPFLKGHGVEEVEVIGVDGGGCVALTAIGAQKNGYKVVLNTGAIGTMFEKNRDKLYARLKSNGAVFVSGSEPCRFQ